MDERFLSVSNLTFNPKLCMDCHHNFMALHLDILLFQEKSQFLAC